MLENLKTNLKSLKYGKDRRGGGDSGQPYVKTSIPSTEDQFIKVGESFLWRENAPQASFIDAFPGKAFGLGGIGEEGRLTKFLFDEKSPKGLLFIAKQNLLSQSGVKTQASRGFLNEGVYNPLSTLLQAQSNYLGYHTEKQTTINTYLSLTSPGIESSFNLIEPVNNRLILLSQAKINNINPKISENSSNTIKLKKLYQKTGISSNPNEILKYNGGPGSILGIGKTRINFASKNIGGYLRTGELKGQLGFKKSWVTFDSNQLGLLGYPENVEGPFSTPSKDDPNKLKEGWLPTKGDNFGGNVNLFDFREPLLNDKEVVGDDPKNPYTTIMGISPSYRPADGQTIDGVRGSRISQTSPGQRGNIYNYTKGKQDGNNKPLGAVDLINASEVYSASSPKTEEYNDLVQFRISAINNNLKTDKESHMHFRAFLNTFSDSYNATWDEIKYMGRAEQMYKYSGFGRTISLSFTLAAQSKPELIPMYKKLNFLASNLAPTYTTGYMAGSLLKLTIGGYLYEQTGFMTNLSIEIGEDSTWEIGINEKGETDNDVRELPHFLSVSFEYIPIHNFRPQKQVDDTSGDYSSASPQRYIALKNKTGKSLY